MSCAKRGSESYGFLGLIWPRWMDGSEYTHDRRCITRGSVCVVRVRLVRLLIVLIVPKGFGVGDQPRAARSRALTLVRNRQKRGQNFPQKSYGGQSGFVALGLGGWDVVECDRTLSIISLLLECPTHRSTCTTFLINPWWYTGLASSRCPKYPGVSVLPIPSVSHFIARSMVPIRGSDKPPRFGLPFSYVSLVSISHTDILRCVRAHCGTRSRWETTGSGQGVDNGGSARQATLDILFCE